MQEKRDSKKAPEVLALVTQQGSVFVRADKPNVIKTPTGKEPHVFNRSEFRGSWLWLHNNKDGTHYTVNMRNVEYLLEQ